LTVHEALTAYERMKEEYRVRPAAMSFEWYEEQHKKYGFLFVRPDVYLACRPVLSTASKEKIEDCTCLFHWSECDCWSISMLSGNMAKAWDFMPWFLPLMCFQRALDSNASLRFYRTEALQRLTLRGNNLNIYAHAGT